MKLSNPMLLSDLPADLVAAVQQQIAAMHAAYEAPCIDLNATQSGRDILSAIAAVGPGLASRWERYDTLLDATTFTPRAYNFVQGGKGHNSKWVHRRVTIASRDLLAGDPDKLRDLLTHLGEQERNGYINLWVRPAPDKGKGVFFVLIRHKDATEAAFSVAHGKWKQIDASPAAIDIILTDLLSLDRQIKNKWVAILGNSAVNADAALRVELRTLFQQWGLTTEPTEEQWREFQEVMFLRPVYMECVVEAAKHLTIPLMHEAQNLLEAVSVLNERAQEATDRKVAQLEREHSRAIKRARADLDKANMSLTGAHTRNRSLAKEIALLQERARTQPAATSQVGLAPNADVSLALALDQFFSE
jgi:hypothetical protein